MLLNDGELTMLNEQELLLRAEFWRERMTDGMKH
jgi:5-methylthioadenosine/S-adenosylhomocysteine deaminase